MCGVLFAGSWKPPAAQEQICLSFWLRRNERTWSRTMTPESHHEAVRPRRTRNPDTERRGVTTIPAGIIEGGDIVIHMTVRSHQLDGSTVLTCPAQEGTPSMRETITKATATTDPRNLMAAVQVRKELIIVIALHSLAPVVVTNILTLVAALAENPHLQVTRTGQPILTAVVITMTADAMIAVVMIDVILITDIGSRP